MKEIKLYGVTKAVTEQQQDGMTMNTKEFKRFIKGMDSKTKELLMIEMNNVVQALFIQIEEMDTMIHTVLQVPELNYNSNNKTITVKDFDYVDIKKEKDLLKDFEKDIMNNGIQVNDNLIIRIKKVKENK